MAEDKDEKTLTTIAEAMLEVTKNATPPGVQEFLKKNQEEMEEQFIVHEDEFAVLHLTIPDLQNNDGWPGYLDVPRNEWTKQGLRKYDRYKVVPFYVSSTDELMYKTVIVTKEEFKEKMGMTPDAYIKSHSSNMTTAFMMRSEE